MNTTFTATPASVEEVLRLSRRRPRWGCQLLDIRPVAPPPRSHLPGSAHLPVFEIQRSEGFLPAHMLPSLGAPLVVLAEEKDAARAVAQQLAARGYRARWLAGSLAALPLRPGPATGALWRPDPYLARRLALLPSAHEGPVADLGAGNGRNAVFLACRGYELHCYDHLPDALELARDRARRHSCTLHTHQTKLIDGRGLAEAPFALILMIRFYSKILMETAASLLRPGGVLLVHTYAAGAVGCEAGSGPRRARHRVSAAEVEALLRPQEWNFVHRSRAFHEPGAAELGFVARKLEVREGGGYERRRSTRRVSL
jgi:SAM-dependent methyltransferase